MRHVLQQPPLRCQKRLDPIRHQIKIAAEIPEFIVPFRFRPQRKIPCAEFTNRGSEVANRIDEMQRKYPAHHRYQEGNQ